MIRIGTRTAGEQNHPANGHPMRVMNSRGLAQIPLAAHHPRVMKNQLGATTATTDLDFVPPIHLSEDHQHQRKQPREPAEGSQDHNPPAKPAEGAMVW